jgi:hypothetical protein
VPRLPDAASLSRAFNSNNNEPLAGVPAGVDSMRVDVIAKTSSDADRP